MDSNNTVILFLKRLLRRFKGFGKEVPDEVVAAKRIGEGQGAQDLGFRDMVSNALEFDIGSLLHPRSLLYILFGVVIFLFLVHNNLAINNLALQNEKLREQIQMTSSVITSQELKMDELHSIRNVAQGAAALGLAASRIPPVELEP